MTSPAPASATIAGEVAAILDALPGGVDPREAFAALGSRQLFAMHYPSRYGGRSATLADQVIVAEALGARQLADEVHLVTVQGVGCTILAYGTDQQRQHWLPQIASGRLQASLLLSERGAGSDAVAIETRAVQVPEGWRLTGEKWWNLHGDWSGLGLCSARTSTSANRYAGITTFLVDLSQDGVSVEAVPRAQGEPYFTVRLDDVVIPDDAVLGLPGQGWKVVTAASGFERAGTDYLSRGFVWLRGAEAVLRGAPELDSPRRRADLARLEHDLLCARALAATTVDRARDLVLDELDSAYSKLMSGEAAQAVAAWIAKELLCEDRVRADPAVVRPLLAAVAEAPELSISGNALDLMLDTISFDHSLGER